ncbi:MAG: hypothetical protein ACTSVI_06950 [Promethearchaeota archaeon]
MPGPPCLECGGKTRFDPSTKRIVCESCGLAVTRAEYEEMKGKMRKQFVYYDDDKRNEKERRKKKNRNRDYLSWWTSEHKE